jgi:bacteriorhodopsin
MKKKHSHKDKIILPFIESINGVPKFIDYININPNSCSEFHYEAYIVDDDYIKVKADVKKYNYYVKYKPWYLYRPTRVKEVYLQEKTGSNEIGCRFKYTKI